MPNCCCNFHFYHRQFCLKAYGSLTDNFKVLFSAEATTYSSVLNKCANFCRGDRRCIGMELCTIREDLYRCRVCCEWLRLTEKTSLFKDSKECKYMEMNEERTSNVAVNKPATIISVFKPDYQFASNAVDNVTVCPNGLSNAHTRFEFNPWVEIDLQNTFDVLKVLIFNRQDQSGNRLHDLSINIVENGTEHLCGFFEGPGVTGGRLLLFCTSGSRGRYVKLMIQSRPGEKDFLHVCEIQVFVAQ
ncbi:uncharacterized protein LOC133194228 [Saccostrea echinata]|uniref:uncharacterized protein LOC133194228 n=1 Tax=Saccostrea echinata TaxID=191078 RepID=UPI002A84005E|nr:uncharacterized protein LOC133194228 [Saccostrea echinata]